MSTRREFLKTTGAISLASAIAGPFATSNSATDTASQRKENLRRLSKTAASVVGAVRREDTLLRIGGDGDNWHMSWAADDRQIIALCDGSGFSDNPKQLYNHRLFSVTGGPQNAMFQELCSYPEKTIQRKRAPGPRTPAYYAFGTLAIDGKIYQYLSNMFDAVKLIYSPDNGCTWRNSDGSTPVVWESNENQSKNSMIFFEEPQNAFSLLSVLQMGKGYELNRDEYVYVYAPNGISEGTMNQLVMFRVPRSRILDRSSYEFFMDRRPDGVANWSSDINKRGVVHTFPRGWVNKASALTHPYAWQPSIAYIEALDVYMMANWGMGCGPDTSAPEGNWFGKPSYLGFWTAKHPWGPWTQIHEEIAWMPGNDKAARAYQPQISPKWISEDGKSFWLVWTDFQHTDAFSPTLLRAFDAETHEEFIRVMQETRRYRPHYAVNAQRVDLVIT